MNDRNESIERHYGVEGILDSILGALASAGQDLQTLRPEDLAAVDEFHVRGREGTLELARRVELAPGQRVLDVGCGLGGSARHLAHEQGCSVDGVDLTDEYVQTARALAELVGLKDGLRFQTASALDLPFADATFDVVWTEHVQMNIEDKGTLYREMLRVLRPGGCLAFHDIFQGEGGPVHFPVPWAEDPAISFLWKPDVAREMLASIGFRDSQWEDRTRESETWFAATLERLAREGRAPLGLHLLMGDAGPRKFQSMARNLSEDRVAVVQAVLTRP